MTGNKDRCLPDPMGKSIEFEFFHPYFDDSRFVLSVNAISSLSAKISDDGNAKK
jgi:hypothetical protein